MFISFLAALYTLAEACVVWKGTHFENLFSLHFDDGLFGWILVVYLYKLPKSDALCRLGIWVLNGAGRGLGLL